jgi:hypothetical protein
MKKEITIPEYLTIKQYMELQKLPDTDSEIEKSLYIVSTITGIELEELRYWDLESIKVINEHIASLVDVGNEFHSMFEWNGVLYGYSNIKQQSLGEYIDLENLCKDVNNNLHKIVSILYRPIVEHDFGTISTQIKHHLKVVRNKGVENVFEHYTIEKYDNHKRKRIENDFLELPVTIALGAISFFLLIGLQYLNNTVYSENKSKMMNEKLINDLIQSIGVGGGLYTHYLKPKYLQLQGIAN